MWNAKNEVCTHHFFFDRSAKPNTPTCTPASVPTTSSRCAAASSCSPGTARNPLKAFHAEGLDCLKPKSSRPHSPRPFLTQDLAPALEDLLPHSPRLPG